MFFSDHQACIAKHGTHLISLPDGHVTKVTNLTSAQSEACTGSGPGESGFEALRAVGERLSFAWSLVRIQTDLLKIKRF